MSAELPIKEDVIQQQILGAAKQLFATYGFAKVNMEDVAKAIGKGRSSLYYYYKSKEELLDAVIQKKVSEAQQATEQAVNRVNTVEEKFYAIYVEKLRKSREKPSFFASLDSGMDADDYSKFNQMKRVHHADILKWEGALLTRILKEAMEKGELKQIHDNEFEDLIFVLLSTLHGIKYEMRMERDVREIEPSVKMMIRILFYGLRG